MLSGGGNAGERWKTTIGVISKKKLCTCSTLFLYISLPLSCMTTTSNFQKLLNYTFHGENCRTFPCSLFFVTSTHVHLALVTASISHFLTAAIKSLCSSSNQKMSPLFFYLSLWISVALFLVDPRWPAAYFLFFSPSFSCSIFQICGHDS